MESLSHSSPNQDQVYQHQRPQSLFSLHLITLSPNTRPQLRPHSLSLISISYLSLSDINSDVVSLSLSASLVFSLSSFQFHRCGVCGLIFAIWFFIDLDCGLCPLGFCFSLSWLLVPGFWFLGLGWVFYFLWVDFFGFGFWFLYLLQTQNHLMGPTRSTDNPSQWVQSEHSVSRGSNFRSPNSIRSGVGQPQTRSDLTREQPYFH